MSKIGIIGTGKIGSHLAEHLLSSDSIDEIHLANRDKDRLEGRLMSLQLHSHLLNSKVNIKKLDFSKVDDLDLIIIAIKDSYDPRKLIQQNGFPDWFPLNLRYVGLFKDLPILENLCNNRLKGYKGRIAVITNPVEITSYFIQRWLPSAEIFGIGASLDSARISYIVKKDLNVNVDKYCCVVAGEHGNELIGVSSLWCQNNCLSDISTFQISDYLLRAKGVGITIVNKLGFTLQDCTPVFADDVKILLSETGHKQFHSFALPTDKTCVSRPIIISGDSITEFTDYTNQERMELGKIEKKIASFILKLSENFEV